MADLEKDINQSENTENTSPVIPSDDDFNIDFSSTESSPIENSEPTAENQINNSVEINAEEAPSNVEVQVNLWEEEIHESFLSGNPLSEEVPEITAEPIPAGNPLENIPEEKVEEPAKEINQDSGDSSVLLWRFDNEMIKSGDETENSEVSPSQVNNQDNEKAKLLQKEKLALLIKEHESKAKRKWFTTWILSGILLTICIAVAGFVFAKDQILDLIGEWNNTQISNDEVIENDDIDNEIIENDDIENVMDDELIDDEEIDDEIEDEENDAGEINDETEDEEVNNEYYDKVKAILSSWLDKESTIKSLNDILAEVINKDEIEDKELTSYISQTILDLSINSEENNTEENNTEENKENSDTTDSQSDSNSSSITRVTSEEEANWVAPISCGEDVFCVDKEFTPCTQFKHAENLNDSAHRVGNGWVCRYKDISELVHVEL